MGLTVAELAFVFGADTREVDRALSGMDNDVSRASRSMDRRMGGFWNNQERRSHRLRGVMKSGFMAAGAGAAALSVGFIALAKKSVTLESAYSNTFRQIAVAGNVPKKKLEELDDLAVKLGKDTIFSAADASSAMLELVKNGITPATVEAGALNSALTLAAAGGLDMATAATSMGNTLNAFGLKGDKAASVAAALAGAANASSASIESMSQGLAQASTVAADAGFTVQETTAAMAAFANAGIAGSDAGTSLKTMIAALVPSTKQAFQAMRAYGLVTYDADKAAKTLAGQGIKAVGTSYKDTYDAVSKYLIQQGVAEEGTVKLADATEDYLAVTGIMHNDFLKKNGDYKSLAAIAGELQKSFKDLSDSERASALGTIFGSDARRAATVLMNEGTKGLAKYIRATSDQTQAEKLAKASMEGTSGALEALKGSAETAMLQFGKGLAPAVEEGATQLADFVDAGDFEAWGRKVSESVLGFAGWVMDDAVPAIKGFVDEARPLAEEVGPALGSVLGIVRDTLKEAAPYAKDLVEAFNDMPDWAKQAIVGGGAGLAIGSKLGLGNPARNLATSVIGSAKPIPVFVTNAGFGAPGGGPGGAVVPGGKPAKPSRVPKSAGPLAILAGIPFLASATRGERARAAGGGAAGVGGQRSEGLGDAAKSFDAITRGAEKSEDAIERTAGAGKRLAAEIFGVHEPVAGLGVRIGETKDKTLTLNGVIDDIPDPDITVRTHGLLEALSGTRELSAELAALRASKPYISMGGQWATPSEGRNKPGSAGGGYTGDGPKYQIAGPVHRGEFVLDQAKTRQYRPLLDAMHRGGTVRMGDLDGIAAAPGGSGDLSRLQGQLDRLSSAVDRMGKGGGRIAPFMDHVTIRATDMRDIERHAQHASVVTAGGGVNF